MKNTNTELTVDQTANEAAAEARATALTAALNDALRAALNVLSARGVRAELTVTLLDGRQFQRDNF